jgi:hypothetical protein
LAFALPATQNTAIGKGIVLDPFDPATARQKLLNGLHTRFALNVYWHVCVST